MSDLVTFMELIEDKHPHPILSCVLFCSDGTYLYLGVRCAIYSYLLCR